MAYECLHEYFRGKHKQTKDLTEYFYSNFNYIFLLFEKFNNLHNNNNNNNNENNDDDDDNDDK